MLNCAHANYHPLTGLQGWHGVWHWRRSESAQEPQNTCFNVLPEVAETVIFEPQVSIRIKITCFREINRYIHRLIARGSGGRARRGVMRIHGWCSRIILGHPRALYKYHQKALFAISMKGEGSGCLITETCMECPLAGRRGVFSHCQSENYSRLQLFYCKMHKMHKWMPVSDGSRMPFFCLCKGSVGGGGFLAGGPKFTTACQRFFWAPPGLYIK